jgi:enoyl-CoA hydratase/carnithine racemase
MSGIEAATIGLMDRSLPTVQALDEAIGELAARVAGGGARALAATKLLLNRLDGSTDSEVVREGARLSAEVVASAEAQAVLRAKFGS